MGSLLNFLTGLNDDVAAKAQKCRDILNDLGRVVVAYSGGVDSSLLLTMAIRELGVPNVTAALAISPLIPRREVDSACALLAELGAECELIQVDKLENPEMLANPPRRCYYCKRDLFREILALAQRLGDAVVVSGDNADDMNDYRPGHQALIEMGVRSPLLEAGLTKDEIRLLARRLGLANWDRPATACLASRIPYGRPITPEKLRRVENAEMVLHEMGFEICRVRDYDELARIELPPDRLAEAVKNREAMIDSLREMGYVFVTLDLSGFRSGSLNQTIGRE